MTVVNASEGIIEFYVPHFSTFVVLAVTGPEPVIVGPKHGAVLTDLSTMLTWANPSGTTQCQAQVIPYNNDGPGIDLVRNVEATFPVKAPHLGASDPNYVMLPGMTYTWRIRATSQAKPWTELKDEDWSPWAERRFRTPTVTSGLIDLVEPPLGSTVDTSTPTLQWTNSDVRVFYYEVQVSPDPEFGPGSFLYWELRHAGVTSPPSSYQIPERFPLASGTQCHWRRVRGSRETARHLPGHGWGASRHQ